MTSHIVLASGGFDPLHDGHMDYLQHAAQCGKVIVAVNSDAWLLRKKGYVLMPWGARARLIGSLPWVYAVIPVNDSDDTVTEAILRIKPDIFVKSGDRKTEKDLPVLELEACKSIHARIYFGIGGNVNEHWHSSDLIRAAAKQLDAKCRT